MVDFISWEIENSPDDSHCNVGNKSSFYTSQIEEEKYPLLKDEQTKLSILMNKFQQQDPLIQCGHTFEADDDVAGLSENMLLGVDNIDIPDEKETKDNKDTIILTRISTIIHEQKITDVNKYLLLQLYYSWKEEKALREALEKEKDKLSKSYINISNMLAKKKNDGETINKLKALISELL